MKVDINVHRRHMGMVFQHFNLFNNKTVLQNVMLAPAYLRCQDLKKGEAEEPDDPSEKCIPQQEGRPDPGHDDKGADQKRGEAAGAGPA